MAGHAGRDARRAQCRPDLRARRGGAAARRAAAAAAAGRVASPRARRPGPDGRPEPPSDLLRVPLTGLARASSRRRVAPGAPVA
ncbi:hypothetical protein DLJ49_01115 [Rhodovulum sp. 12E13]|nr:hypothetical protein DLJ49_01115 [Rhodovulum sp. 12E13]